MAVSRKIYLHSLFIVAALSRFYAVSGQMVSGRYPLTNEIVFVSDTQQPMWEEELFLHADHNLKATAMIFSDILKQAPLAVYFLGDVVAWGYKSSKWTKVDAFLDSCHKKGIRAFGLLGNHDVMGEPLKGERNFQKRFPDHVRTGYLSLVDSTAIILLNSNFQKLSAEDRRRQQSWYDSTLRSLDTSPRIKGIIVACHHAPYSNSRIVGSSQPVQEQFVPSYLSSRKAVLFITGHSHNFEYFKVKEKTFLVIGGGGGLHQPLDTTERRRPDLAPGYKPEFHYLKLAILADRLHFTSRSLKPDFTGFTDGFSFDIPYNLYPATNSSASVLLSYPEE
jgi:UDP-2,3-diacylglucosamine pyrophosphatase LpxH